MPSMVNLRGLAHNLAERAHEDIPLLWVSCSNPASSQSLTPSGRQVPALTSLPKARFLTIDTLAVRYQNGRHRNICLEMAIR